MRCPVSLLDAFFSVTCSLSQVLDQFRDNDDDDEEDGGASEVPEADEIVSEDEIEDDAAAAGVTADSPPPTDDIDSIVSDSAATGSDIATSSPPLAKTPVSRRSRKRGNVGADDQVCSAAKSSPSEKKPVSRKSRKSGKVVTNDQSSSKAANSSAFAERCSISDPSSPADERSETDVAEEIRARLSTPKTPPSTMFSAGANGGRNSLKFILTHALASESNVELMDAKDALEVQKAQVVEKVRVFDRSILLNCRRYLSTKVLQFATTYGANFLFPVRSL